VISDAFDDSYREYSCFLSLLRLIRTGRYAETAEQPKSGAFTFICIVELTTKLSEIAVTGASNCLAMAKGKSYE
jgi:hypothetical protein